MTQTKWHDMTWNDMKWHDMKWHDMKWNENEWIRMRWIWHEMWCNEIHECMEKHETTNMNDIMTWTNNIMEQWT